MENIKTLVWVMVSSCCEVTLLLTEWLYQCDHCLLLQNKLVDYWSRLKSKLNPNSPRYWYGSSPSFSISLHKNHKMYGIVTCIDIDNIIIQYVINSTANYSVDAQFDWEASCATNLAIMVKAPAADISGGSLGASCSQGSVGIDWRGGGWSCKALQSLHPLNNVSWFP